MMLSGEDAFPQVNSQSATSSPLGGGGEGGSHHHSYHAPLFSVHVQNALHVRDTIRYDVQCGGNQTTAHIAEHGYCVNHR